MTFQRSRIALIIDRLVVTVSKQEPSLPQQRRLSRCAPGEQRRFHRRRLRRWQKRVPRFLSGAIGLDRMRQENAGAK
jgi:hypothetical protein